MMIVALVVCGAGVAFGVAVGSSYVRIRKLQDFHERGSILMFHVRPL